MRKYWESIVCMREMKLFNNNERCQTIDVTYVCEEYIFKPRQHNNLNSDEYKNITTQ